MHLFQSVIEKELSAVNEKIIDQLASKVPLVENIGHYIIDAGGKRLRPILALLAGKITRYQPEHVDFATVIEFIHTATLLHDDVVDVSELRRGKPTANAHWNNASSVLVGDFIYSRAFQILVKLKNMHIMAMMADVTNQIAEGEVLQLVKAGDIHCTMDEYLQVISDKTAILFSAAMKGSAIISHANEQQQSALATYGHNLGVAFQLADDVLDYQGNIDLIGKNLGDDLNEGKLTMPMIYSLKEANTADRALLEETITAKSNQNLSVILQIFDRYGAIAYTHQQASFHVDQAKAALSIFTDSTEKQALLAIADFALNRAT